MKCRQMQGRVSALLDGELSTSEEREVLQHIELCEACREEYRELRALEDIMSKVQLPCIPDAEWDEHWSRLYNRLERGLGYLLFGVGVIVLLTYGFVFLLESWFRDPSVPPALKFGTGALAVGLIILAVSTVREKLMIRRHERYREIIR